MGLKENIKIKRTQNKMTLEELASKVGVSRQTIQRYESGIISNIPSDKIEAMAKALNTTPAYLMGWLDTAKENNPTKEELHLFHQNTYENLVIKEMEKMNQKGKVKLLDTAREMVCNPLYNPGYEIELNAAHARTDIDIPEGVDTSDDDVFDDF